MTVLHIVLFEWKSTASRDQISQACSRMLALGENCLHPDSNKPYVKSIAGGINNSPEGLAAPQTHGFIVEFGSEEDRDYYVNKDPVHLSFVADAGKIINSIKVLDFVPGKF